MFGKRCWCHDNHCAGNQQRWHGDKKGKGLVTFWLLVPFKKQTLWCHHLMGIKRNSMESTLSLLWILDVQCLQNIKYWWNGDLKNLAHSSQTTVKQKISTECESKCLPNISGLNSAFVGNWRPCVCKNSLQQSKCKLWQKDQMTPTAPRNWMSCPWWAIARITRNLGELLSETSVDHLRDTAVKLKADLC